MDLKQRSLEGNSMYEQTEEVYQLINIINLFFDIDMTDKNRKRKYIIARMIYAKLLKEKGYTLVYIGKVIGKDHATIIHYLDIIDWDLKNDFDIREAFNKIKALFYKDYDPILTLDEHQLKNKIFSMKNELYNISLEKEFLRKNYEALKDEEVRLLPILKMVRERTMKGKEHIVIRKLNALFNSIT